MAKDFDMTKDCNKGGNMTKDCDMTNARTVMTVT